jgi:hypothetical protein
VQQVTVKPYGLEHALALLEPSSLAGEWTVDERGLWPLESHKHLWHWGMHAEYEVTAWKPSVVFADDPDAPDLTKTPALPFPFDGNDLAALMLAGSGLLLADFFGEWESGPDADALARINPGNNFARRAVTEAFEAYRFAVGRVGSLQGEDGNIEAWRHWIRAMAAELLRPVTGPAEPVVQAKAIDLSVLAGPGQLIAAFGKFTGMDASWFDNLTDTPRLLAARKVTGTGGKHYTPPLFCPFEVMQWLIDEKRKKGRKVSPDKAWQLLQSNFEKVYNTRSAGDPR